MTKLLLLVLILSFSSLAGGKIKVSVDLVPLGDFVAEGKVLGKAIKKGNGFEAQNIKMRVKGLKTGLELRDKHMYDYLKADEHPFAKLTGGVAKNGKGEAVLNFMGKDHKVPFTYKEQGKKVIANFKLSASKLGIEEISYKGVGVQDELQVEVHMDYE